MDLDSIGIAIYIARASAISIDLGTLLASILYKPYLVLRILHFMVVAATIRDKHSLDRETRQ